MKKWMIISTLLLALILTGCNLPGYEGTSPEDADAAMATEISRILTGTPIELEETLAPEEEETTVPEESETAPTQKTEPEVVEEEEEEEQEETQEETTPEPTSTPTITPTATLSETDPAKSLGEPDWADSMDNGDNWPTGYNEYTTIKFENGYLKLTGETELDGWRLSWPFLSDFYVEAKIQTPKCEGSDHFGLMFRVPANANANKGYLFGITCDGDYSLRRWDGQTMYFPVDWTESSAINTGENAINTLGVMAKGADLVLYINGQKVKEVSDNAYAEGSFGVFVGSVDTEDVTIWVDQIRYWEKP